MDRVQDFEVHVPKIVAGKRELGVSAASTQKIVGTH